MTMAVSAPAAPAFDASQRRGTSSQNSTTTGSAASSVDQNATHGMPVSASGSSC